MCHAPTFSDIFSYIEDFLGNSKYWKVQRYLTNAQALSNDFDDINKFGESYKNSLC